MSILVGIAGGSGSGKTTFARGLQAHFRPHELLVLPLDAYYLDRKGMAPAERERINYDHPSAFDTTLLYDQLQALRAGQPIEQPVYDYVLHERTSQAIAHPAPAIVVLEGILVLALERIRPLLDLKLYVDTGADLRLLRRLRRDVTERGRTPESVMEQYLATVRPMHVAHIEPTKAHADVILPGIGAYETALEIVAAWCRERIGS